MDLEQDLENSSPRRNPLNQTRPDHQKISFTAKLVALGRSKTSIPFAKEVSELVDAPAIGAELAQVAGSSDALPPFMVPLVEARYLSMVSAIKRSGVKQVLEFASGVSLRGLAMTLKNPTLTYIETDLPALTAEKQRIMKSILERHHLEDPPKHHIAVTNILSWQEIEMVLSRLTPGEPVAVVHEGLFMYLTQEEKQVAGRNIARILDLFGGVWLTPDFTPVTSAPWLIGEVKESFAKLMAAIEERTGRSFAQHSFESDDDALSFCNSLGFKANEYPQIDGSYTLSSVPSELEGNPMMTKLRENLMLWEMRRT